MSMKIDPKLVQRASDYTYRGDDDYQRGNPIGSQLDEEANERDRANEAYFHIKDDKSKKTERYTSFSLERALAGKFTKKNKISKVGWEALRKLEAEGVIRILEPDDVVELIRKSGKKKFAKLATLRSIRDTMVKNNEVLIEGQIPAEIILFTK